MHFSRVHEMGTARKTILLNPIGACPFYGYQFRVAAYVISEKRVQNYIPARRQIDYDGLQGM